MCCKVNSQHRNVTTEWRLDLVEGDTTAMAGNVDENDRTAETAAKHGRKTPIYPDKIVAKAVAFRCSHYGSIK